MLWLRLSVSNGFRNTQPEPVHIEAAECDYRKAGVNEISL